MLILIGVSRDIVFTTKVIIHRPTENRDHYSTEITACRIWLNKQLEIVKSKEVLTLRKHSLERYIPKAKNTQAHDQPVKVNDQVVLLMYHPAAVLSNGIVMERLKEDFQNNASLLKNQEKVGLRSFNDKEDYNDQISTI